MNDPESIGSEGNDLEQHARLPNHRLRLISPPAFAGSSRPLRFQISLRAPVLRCRYGLTVNSRAGAAPTVLPIARMVRATIRRKNMPAIGFVTRSGSTFKGQLRRALS